jgi:hypothetical protein
MSSHNLKTLNVIDSLARVGPSYRKTSFVHHKWKEQRVQYATVVDTDYVEAYTQLLRDPLSKEYNLTEFVFEMAKEFPGAYLCTAILVSSKDTEYGFQTRKVDARLILNYNHKFLSSDDIFDMYKSVCVFAHIGLPKTIEMSCSMKKRTICPDDNLLMLSHTEELSEIRDNVKGKVS